VLAEYDRYVFFYETSWSLGRWVSLGVTHVFGNFSGVDRSVIPEVAGTVVGTHPNLVGLVWPHVLAKIMTINKDQDPVNPSFTFVVLSLEVVQPCLYFLGNSTGLA
jgi:hypothetical protein